MLTSKSTKGLSNKKISAVSEEALEVEDSAKEIKAEPWYLSNSIATLSNTHIDYFLIGREYIKGCRRGR